MFRPGDKKEPTITLTYQQLEDVINAVFDEPAEDIAAVVEGIVFLATVTLEDNWWNDDVKAFTVKPLKEIA